MRLTQLELKGFKSFADRTVIHFDNDITGVVGPNGCGKSNVVDAIRWVLGEQRAKTLRLEKMDNIIFNGTKDRKPSNLAEVSLTFDNTRNILPTEYSQITITRALYRSGDSEYKINGVTCRLKDIRDLFLDTGVGSSTYAIMELKMIDDILNDVDNSRRLLIEQAAGISKYKTRKHETLLKLNATEADLDRVADLLFEINSNLKALESQARKANRYKKLKEEYKVLSIALARWDILSINSQYEALEQQMTALQDGKTGQEAGIQKREAALQQLKTGILDKEKSLSAEQKELNQFIQSIQHKESDKKVGLQKIEFLNKRILSLQHQATVLAAERETLAAESTDLEEKIATEQTTMESFKTAVDSARLHLEEKRGQTLRLKEDLEQQRLRFQGVRNQLNESEKMLAIRDSRLESLRSSIQKSLFEKEERLESLKHLDVAIEKLAVDVQRQEALIQSLDEKEQSNAAHIVEFEAEIETSRNALIETRRTLDAKQNEFRLTRNMVDSLEGFPESIKYLKKNADWLKGAPLLSDILYSEEKYRIALELALKPYLNHFIVTSEEDATRAIEQLGSSGKGRAQFFVLEDFKALGKVAKPGKAPKGWTSAAAIVEVDEIYQPLLAFLLQDVYITDGASEAADFKGESALLVDLSGKWIRSKVALSGGTVGLFEGKRLGRLKNLEKLEKEIAALKETVQAGDEKLRKAQAELLHLKNNSYRKTIERERQELQQLERQLVTHQSRMENFREFIDRQSRENLEVEAQIKGIESEVLVLKEQFDKATGASGVEQHKMDSLDHEFKAVSLEFSKLQEQFQEKHILFIQHENALQSYKQSKKFKESRLETVKVEIERSESESAAAAEEIKALTGHLNGMDDELIALYKESEVMKQALSGKETAYYEQKEKVQEEEDAIRKLYRQKEDLDQQMQQHKERKSQLKFELQSLQQRLSLEFKVDVHELLDEPEAPDRDRTELELKIDSVARRIDNFGEVNPMAETAYDEMKTRFDFITEQKADLEQARTSLLTTIEEIETTAKEHFMDSFLAIRENFKNVFRSMFSEHDNCDLILVDPEQPLESKVEIIARPKGKRPQSINQLSGGEKSLTSLSLLFALYLYKPAPFCILDEVDAPLDDANVQKFNRAIRNFATDSQFIVVTHNKQTMAAVDVAYGVTMQKAGISMLVPADFRQARTKEEMAEA